jgi:hypothetical protein
MSNNPTDADTPEIERSVNSAGFRDQSSESITCPVCGASVVQEKCKLVCRSETCRGRIVMNCSEF